MKQIFTSIKSRVSNSLVASLLTACALVIFTTGGQAADNCDRQVVNRTDHWFGFAICNVDSECMEYKIPPYESVGVVIPGNVLSSRLKLILERDEIDHASAYERYQNIGIESGLEFRYDEQSSRGKEAGCYVKSYKGPSLDKIDEAEAPVAINQPENGDIKILRLPQ